MKLFFIYDSSELTEIGVINFNIPKYEQIHILTINEDGKKRKLYDVAKDIKNQAKKTEPCIIFIDQFLVCADEGFEWLQRNAGIALVKFLRLMEVRHHVVFITPYSPLQLIVENPDNLIVSSRGISLSKNLYEFKEKSIKELEELASDNFDEKQDLKPYLLVELRLPEDERHNWANWWGIVRLTDVHRNLFPNELSYGVNQYPSNIDEKLKSLKSVQALSLFHNVLEIKKAIDETELELYSKQKRILLSEIEKLEKQINGTGKRAKLDYWADLIIEWQNLIAEKAFDKSFDKSYIETLIALTNIQLEHGRISLKEKEEELINIEKKIGLFFSKELNISESFSNKISQLRFTSNKGFPKIVYIDDNANIGWSDLFQELVYGCKQDENIFKPIHDTKKEIEILCEELIDIIFKMDPHLILLDLRLNKEEGTQRDVEELSGAIVLEKLREHFPGLPIMMTTASNKVLSYKTILDIGADAYWMKEGLDTSASFVDNDKANYSINNYYNFISLINKLASDEYQFMRRTSQGIEKLKSIYKPETGGKLIKPLPWWKDTSGILDWNKVVDNKRLLSNPEYLSVFDLLDIGLKMYRNNFLKHFRLNSKELINNLIEDEKITLANIINTLHQIIELIHRNNSNEPYGLTVLGGYFRKGGISLSDSREDFMAMYLTSFRHSSSHRGGILKIKYEYFKSYFAGLLTYLSVSAYIKFDQSSIGIINKSNFNNNKEWGTNGINSNINFITMINSIPSYKIIFDELLTG